MTPSTVVVRGGKECVPGSAAVDELIRLVQERYPRWFPIHQDGKWVRFVPIPGGDRAQPGPIRGIARRWVARYGGDQRAVERLLHRILRGQDWVALDTFDRLVTLRRSFVRGGKRGIG